MNEERPGSGFGGELAVAAVLLALLFIVFDPWNMAMPDYAVTSLLVGLVAAFAAFASFVWRERPADEREILHRFFADRAAFLAGSAVLLAAVVAEETARALDPWTVAALAAMVLAKVAALIYGKYKL